MEGFSIWTASRKKREQYLYQHRELTSTQPLLKKKAAGHWENNAHRDRESKKTKERESGKTGGKVRARVK